MDEPVVVQEPANEETVPDGSILATIKHMIGPSDDYSYFDTDLIIHINAAFSRLCQLGVGQEPPFHITGDTEVWTDFIAEAGYLEDVKQFVYHFVRHDFDPPTSGALMDALEKRIDKLEWLLNSVAEVGY